MFENQQLTGSCCASGGYSRIGGYRVFLVAIEYPIFQLVDRLFGVFKQSPEKVTESDHFLREVTKSDRIIYLVRKGLENND